MAKIGRPTKLTPGLKEVLITALSSGCYRATAAAHAGISTPTLYKWLETGEADLEHGRDTDHADLRMAVIKAEADAEQEALQNIREQSKQQWQASAWFLERKWPNRWGRREHVEHSGEIGGKVHNQAVYIVPDEDQLVRVAEILDEARRSPGLNGN